MLHAAQRLSSETGGAFDVTVGPLTKLWRRARRQHQLPSAVRMSAARAATDYTSVVLDAKTCTAQLLKPGMRLDVGGIAKGYAADQALLELTRLGICRALVNASGDMSASGPPPGKPGWVVGVAPLQPSAPPSLFGYLANQSIATSGDAFQYVEIDGKRYSHIVDPRTGLGLTQRSSVSILADNGTDADAIASAVSVMGPDAGLKFVKQRAGVEALIIVEKEGQAVTRQTAGFRQWGAVQPKK